MSNSAITGPILSDVRRAPAGTAAAPSFSFNDSTGTGVYLVSAGVLGLSTNGVQRVVIDASGNLDLTSGNFFCDTTSGVFFSGGPGSFTNGIYGTGINNVAINTAGSPRMTIDASGNVGIGTGSPARKLHVDASGPVYATIRNSANNVNTTIGATTTDGWVGTESNHPLKIYTNATERMHIDSSGNVGIGLTTGNPTAKLDVQGTSNPSLKVWSRAGTTGNYAELQLHSYNTFSGFGQTYIRAINTNSGNSGTALAFGTEDSGFGGPIERMRLDQSGALTVGSVGNTTHILNGLLRTQKQEASGGFRTVHSFFLDSGATACGGIQVINGSTLPQFFTGSDEKLKSNIEDDKTDYLSKINQVKLRTFTLNTDESQTIQTGVIAQELQTVFPDLVSEGDDGMLRVGSNYQYKLIGAIQMLTAQVEQLSAKNDALEARLAALENK